jgi:hypothetical protein
MSIFDSIASSWAGDGYGTDIRPAGQGTFSYRNGSGGDGGGDLGQVAYNYGNGINPADLVALGWLQPGYSENDMQQAMARAWQNGGYSPEFQQELKNRQIQSLVGTGESGGRQGFFGANGQIGPGSQWGEGSDDAFGLAMLAAGGAAGGAAAGAFGGAAGGAGGAAGAAGAGGGLSSADLAALYGAGGYGEGMGAAGAAAGAGGAGAGFGGAGLGTEGFGAGLTPLTAAGPSATAGGAGGLLGQVGGYLGTPAGLGTIAQLGTGLMGSIAAQRAAQAQVDSTKDANALAKYMYEQNRSDNMPALQARNAGLGGMQNLLANPGSIVNDPGYQFQLGQGVQARDRSAAAHGGLYSGAQEKALTRFGTDYGSTKLNDSYNRLASLAGAGQVGAGQIGQSGQNYANQAGQNMIGAGNANASGYVGSANAWGNAIQGAYNGWQQQNLLDQWMKRGGP